MWDGKNWSAFGDGLKGFTRVRAVAASGTRVYAGGLRFAPDDLQDSGVMAWDGANWTSLPPSSTLIENDVRALATQGNDLYVAGSLYLGDGSKRHSILKWDGATWSAPGGGLPGNARTVTVSGTDIYVGGD